MSTENMIQMEAEKIETATGKKMLTIEDAAEFLVVSTQELAEIIRSGETPIKLIGKKYIIPMDLARFRCGIFGNEVEKIIEKPLDLGFPQRYHSPLLIEDLNEEGYKDMERRGKGEGSVFFNEGRQQWQAAISLGKDENGKRLRKIISGKEKEDVLETLVKFMSNSDSVTEQKVVIPEANPKTKSITLKEFLDKLLKTMQGKPRSRTFANYIGTAKHIENELGHINMSELTKDDIQNFLNDFSSKSYVKGNTVSKYSKSAIDKVYILINTLVREAYENDLIKKRFLLEKPKSKKRVEKKYKALKDNEIRAIYDAVGDHSMLKLAIMIMAYTGMRPGEVFALRFSDVDFENGMINVEQAISMEWDDVDIVAKKYMSKRYPVVKNLKNDDEGRSAYACRSLKITPKVLSTIKEWQKHIESKPELMEKKKKNGLQDLIFTGVHGQLVLLEYYHQVYERHLSKNRLSSKEYYFYRFRHTYCTRLLKKKTDLQTVMRLMGDNTLDIIMLIYNSLEDSDVIKASDDYSIEMDDTLENII